MSLSVQILLKNLIGDAAPAGARNAAALAMESRDFVHALRLLEAQKDELDAEGLVRLAMALEGTGRQNEAIELLEKYAGAKTDPIGVLAGRLKRRWLAGRRRADAERALSLYRKAYDIAAAKSDHAQAYYHGINVAFMELAYGSDHEAARAMASEVLKHCAASPDGKWRQAAEGEANLILGQTSAALDGYRRALSLQPRPWEVASMFQQALRLADLVGDDAATSQLTALYTGQGLTTA
jgi:tetratricopeptide (TPR) repeat protein